MPSMPTVYAYCHDTGNAQQFHIFEMLTRTRGEAERGDTVFATGWLYPNDTPVVIYQNKEGRLFIKGDTNEYFVFCKNLKNYNIVFESKYFNENVKSAKSATRAIYHLHKSEHNRIWRNGIGELRMQNGILYDEHGNQYEFTENDLEATDWKGR